MFKFDNKGMEGSTIQEDMQVKVPAKVPARAPEDVIERIPEEAKTFPQNYISMLEGMTSEDRLIFLKKQPEGFIKLLLNSWIHNNVQKDTEPHPSEKDSAQNILVFISKMEQKEFSKLIQTLPKGALEVILNNWHK